MIPYQTTGCAGRGHLIYLCMYVRTKLTCSLPSLRLPAVPTPQDHMGAAGFVYNHFAQRDSVAPTIIASSRIRRSLNVKEKRSPTSDWYNNRGVPIPEKMSQYEYEHIMVGGLTLEVTKINAHMAGDVQVYLDKTVPGNAAQGE